MVVDLPRSVAAVTFSHTTRKWHVIQESLSHLEDSRCLKMLLIQEDAETREFINQKAIVSEDTVATHAGLIAHLIATQSAGYETVSQKSEVKINMVQSILISVPGEATYGVSS